MKPIFDRRGKTVAWLNGNVIVDNTNRCKAFIANDSVYNYSSKHLGVLDGGRFRDHQGDTVAYVDGAGGVGPLLPIHEIPPIPSIPPIPPIPPVPSIPPIPAIPTFDWSRYSWDQFLNR